MGKHKPKASGANQQGQRGQGKAEVTRQDIAAMRKRVVEALTQRIMDRIERELMNARQAEVGRLMQRVGRRALRQHAEGAE